MPPTLTPDAMRRAEIWGLTLALGLKESEAEYLERREVMERQSRAQLEMEWPEASSAEIDALLARFTRAALGYCESFFAQILDSERR